MKPLLPITQNGDFGGALIEALACISFQLLLCLPTVNAVTMDARNTFHRRRDGYERGEVLLLAECEYSWMREAEWMKCCSSKDGYRNIPHPELVEAKHQQLNMWS